METSQKAFFLRVKASVFQSIQQGNLLGNLFGKLILEANVV